MKNSIKRNKRLISTREYVAKWLALHNSRIQEVETTSEGKSILPILYKKWAKRLRV